jgi:hypothetical protein
MPKSTGTIGNHGVFVDLGSGIKPGNITHVKPRDPVDIGCEPGTPKIKHEIFRACGSKGD